MQLFLMLVLTSNMIKSSDSSDDEFGDIPDSTVVDTHRLQTNSWKEFADRTVPAFKAVAQATTHAAATTGKVLAGAYSGAVAAVSEKPLQECAACRQRQAAQASYKTQSSFHAHIDSDDDIDSSDYTNVSPNRPFDTITKELEDKAKISSLEKADLFQKINDYIKQTYSQDTHRLSEEQIQQRVNLLILTSQEQSNMAVGHDVSISKQTALFYVEKQLEILDRQLKKSSEIEEAAEIIRNSNIQLAASKRAHAIEQIEERFARKKTKEEKIYNKTLAQEFHIGSLLASNTRHLFERAEKELPSKAEPNHYQNAQSFQNLLTSLRPKIAVSASADSSVTKASKKK